MTLSLFSIILSAWARLEIKPNGANRLFTCSNICTRGGRLTNSSKLIQTWKTFSVNCQQKQIVACNCTPSFMKSCRLFLFDLTNLVWIAVHAVDFEHHFELVHDIQKHFLQHYVYPTSGSCLRGLWCLACRNVVLPRRFWVCKAWTVIYLPT